VTNVVPDDSGLFGITSLTPSPDGSRLALAARDLLIPTLTPVPDLDTGLRVGLRSGVAAHPSGQDIWLVNRDGSGLRRLFELVESNLSLAWSADGSVLYAVGPSGFWQIDPASGDSLRLGDGLPFAQITPLRP
jgi:Tol biopolymer transport system component